MTPLRAVLPAPSRIFMPVTIKWAMIWVVKTPIWAYRLTLSSFVGHACRYHPTCSTYALEAVDTHGPFRGGLMALKRIGRCHPWGGSGLDLVTAADKDNSPDVRRSET
jgi:putative membrane protein insertion efficiency factor